MDAFVKACTTTLRRDERMWISEWALSTGREEMQRCEWAEHSQWERDYHDETWGVPEHDDQRLFEMLVLESMQAGLSWLTVLKKREAFQQAFDGFDLAVVAEYDESKIQQLLGNEKIIRNRLKVRAAVNNAGRFLEIQQEFGSFDRFVWGYVQGVPVQNQWQQMSEIPAKTALSDRISKDLKKRGFAFVGSTIVYSFLQATGMINDHVVGCDFYEKVKGKSS